MNLGSLLARLAPECQHCGSRNPWYATRCQICIKNLKLDPSAYEEDEIESERAESELREKYPEPPLTCDSCEEPKDSTERVPGGAGGYSYLCAECDPDRTTDPDRLFDRDLSIEPFTDAQNPEKYEVTIDGRAYVLTTSELRAFLSEGMSALGHAGTKPWLEAER